MENGSGRSAVHGMVNCRSSARIRACSGLRFLPRKLQKASKSIKCMVTSLKLLSRVGKRLAVLGPKHGL